ncbi:MAG: c-type cytochrome, partial [Candidatus Sericytochromatia bacterium]
RVTPEAQAFFQSRCAACHGGEGQGGVGPALTGVDARGDAFIATMIRDGSPNKGMPAFGAQLSPEELANLVAYVKSL